MESAFATTIGCSTQREPVTIEGCIPGTFTKYINNNGECYSCPEQCTAVSKELQLKAECLVQLTYESTDQQLMLLDNQKSGYQLYAPEITRTQLFLNNTTEVYLCCGNLSIVAIAEFAKKHACGKYCEMLEFPDKPKDRFE